MSFHFHYRSEHVMIVTDWIHELSIDMFTEHHHSIGDNKPPTLLINGVGRFRVFNDTAIKTKYMKTARFDVEQVCFDYLHISLAPLYSH